MLAWKKQNGVRDERRLAKEVRERIEYSWVAAVTDVKAIADSDLAGLLKNPTDTTERTIRGPKDLAQVTVAKLMSTRGRPQAAATTLRKHRKSVSNADAPSSIEADERYYRALLIRLFGLAPDDARSVLTQIKRRVSGTTTEPRGLFKEEREPGWLIASKIELLENTVARNGKALSDSSVRDIKLLSLAERQNRAARRRKAPPSFGAATRKDADDNWALSRSAVVTLMAI